MPQLMPLTWIYSSFMIILIVMVLINLYYYKEIYFVNVMTMNYLEMKVIYKW